MERARHGLRGRCGSAARRDRGGLRRRLGPPRRHRDPGPRASAGRRARDPAPPNRGRLTPALTTAALPELATVPWRPPVDRARLQRRARGWTAWTVATTVPFAL